MVAGVESEKDWKGAAMAKQSEGDLLVEWMAWYCNTQGCRCGVAYVCLYI